MFLHYIYYCKKEAVQEQECINLQGNAILYTFDIKAGNVTVNTMAKTHRMVLIIFS